ncbi:hypothetical protein B0T11DRAFT_287052 [Plectosphaerella cucumerina]|uniref:Zn(2)-C6 fungal-type domain-containing protein n=1 Tax=Plectosphaerella cucumerina TaxID=40658 RepID=A0A8K0X0U4_9PEZI|nr:hypothetical protein B0T11DRAFT_287052 [Plectosphaerella cucumerina]
MPPSARTTRITAACKACRARKHRCSGERPRCAQCTTNDVRCEWPQQQKRGPPKEYRTALESRLNETENVLLALLQEVSQAQLEAAFRRFPAIRYARKDDAGPSHWNDFPLQSPDEVRHWADYHVAMVRDEEPTSSLSANMPSGQRFDLPQDGHEESRVSRGSSGMDVADSVDLGRNHSASEIEVTDVVQDDMSPASLPQRPAAARGARARPTTRARLQEQQPTVEDYDSAYVW